MNEIEYAKQTSILLKEAIKDFESIPDLISIEKRIPIVDLEKQNLDIQKIIEECSKLNISTKKQTLKKEKYLIFILNA